MHFGLASTVSQARPLWSRWSLQAHVCILVDTGLRCGVEPTPPTARDVMAGRYCTVCTHADCTAINTALADALSLRTIARRYGLSKTAVLRHRDRHLFPPTPVEVSLNGHVAQGPPLAPRTLPPAPAPPGSGFLESSQEERRLYYQLLAR